MFASEPNSVMILLTFALKRFLIFAAPSKYTEMYKKCTKMYKNVQKVNREKQKSFQGETCREHLVLKPRLI